MMYLTRLFPNPRNTQVRKEIASPYELHRTLLNAFPDGEVHINRRSGDAVGMLFRLDEDPRDHLITILVQSKTAPDWRFLETKIDGRGQPYLLPAAYLSEDKPNPAMTQFDLSTRLRTGQTFAFRLRANPTKRLGKSAGEEKKGLRVGIFKEENQIEWLMRKAENGGFRIINVTTSHDERITDEKKKLKWLSVQFDGLLEVKEPSRLAETVVNGLGSAKGFGFGLLSLAPIRG